MTIRKIMGVTVDADTLDGEAPAAFEDAGVAAGLIAAHAAVRTGIHGITVLVKPDDQSVNNSETLVNDEDLVLPVGADDVWFVIVLLRLVSESVTPDLDYAFAVPSGGTVNVIDADEFKKDSAITPADGTAEQTLATSSTEQWLFVIEVYTGGGTAGNLQLQWAQNVATVENTTVKAKSAMICQRMA